MRTQAKVALCVIGLTFFTLAVVDHPVLGLSLLPVNQIRLNCGNNGPILIIGNLTDEDAQAIPGSAFSIQCQKGSTAPSMFNFSRIFLASDAHFSVISGDAGWLTICNLGPNLDLPFRTNIPYYIRSPSTGTCGSTLSGQSGDGSVLFTANLSGPTPPSLRYSSSLSLYHIQVLGTKLEQRTTTSLNSVPVPARLGITGIKATGNGEPKAVVFSKPLTDVGPGTQWTPPNRIRLMLVPPGPGQSCSFDNVPLTPIDPKAPGSGPWCLIAIPLIDRTTNSDRVQYRVDILIHYGYVHRTYTLTITVRHHPASSTGSLSLLESESPHETEIRMTHSVLKSTDQGRIFVEGSGIDSLQLEVFNLAGARVLSARADGSQLRFRPQDARGRPLAAGVYLYRVTAWDAQGRIAKDEIRKLLIVR